MSQSNREAREASLARRSVSKLNAEIKKLFAEHSAEHALTALDSLYLSDPGKYLQLALSLLPREDSVNVKHSGAVGFEHKSVSETASFIATALGDGQTSPLPKPLLN